MRAKQTATPDTTTIKSSESDDGERATTGRRGGVRSNPQSSEDATQHTMTDHGLPPGMQTSGIEVHNDHDVLCGRGGGSYKHLGNSTYRHLVNLNKELYLSCKKHEKIKISQAIVAAIRSQNPPGRFLEKEAATGLWYDIGDKKAVEKTSQALREGAPKLRQKLTGEGKTPETAGTGSAADAQVSTPAPEAFGGDNKLKPATKARKARSKSPTPRAKASPQAQPDYAPPLPEDQPSDMPPSLSDASAMFGGPSMSQNMGQMAMHSGMDQYSPQNYAMSNGGLGDYGQGGYSMNAMNAMNPQMANDGLPPDPTNIPVPALPPVEDFKDSHQNDLLGSLLRESFSNAQSTLSTLGGDFGGVGGGHGRASNTFRNSTHSILTDYSDMLDSITSFDLDDDLPFDDKNVPGSNRSSMRFSLSNFHKQAGQKRSGSLFRGSNHSVLTDFSDISEALESIQMEDGGDDEDDGPGTSSGQDGERRRPSVRFSFARQPSERRSAFALDQFAKMGAPQDKPDNGKVMGAAAAAAAVAGEEGEEGEGENGGQVQDMDVSRYSMKSRGSVRFSLPAGHQDRGMSTLMRGSFLSDFSGFTDVDGSESVAQGGGSGGGQQDGNVLLWDVNAQGGQGGGARRKSSLFMSS